MTETKVIRFEKAPVADQPRLEPSTCTEAETFALQVLDSSMEPEFPQKCIIVVDPTGHATHGSYVLARSHTHSPGQASNGEALNDSIEGFLFRQLVRNSDNSWSLSALDNEIASEPTAADLSDIVGVIVQRAGTRRRLHKRYD